MFATIEEAVADIREGRIVVVVDDADRDVFAVARGKLGDRLDFAANEGLVAATVCDQVGDRDELEPMLL